MSDKDLSYRLPPDVLHYEPSYIFGLSLQDILVSVMPSILVINSAGIVWGGVVGLLMLLAMKRWDGLGDRSAVVYAGSLLWYRYRPSEVVTPRVLPLNPSRVEVHSWAGERLYVLEGKKK